MVNCVPLVREKTTEAPQQSEVFAEGATWEILKPQGDIIVGPCKDMFQDPTMSQELADLEFDNVEKLNYQERFERPEFTGALYQPRLNCFKNCL